MYQKKLVSCAVGLALGFGVAAANAAAVTSWTLTDFDGDGLKSDFNFNTLPPGNSGNTFGAGDEMCGGAPCADIAFDAGAIGADVFSTGFNFGGGGDFDVLVTGSMSADIDTVAAAAGDGQALQFSALDWGGIYQGTANFSLPPDTLANCTDAAPGAFGAVCGDGAAGDNPGLTNPQGYNVVITDLGAGDYGVVVTFTSTIANSGTSYDGNISKWRLEGVMHTGTAPIPVPAAVWLFGSGLLGLVGVARRRKSA